MVMLTFGISLCAIYKLNNNTQTPIFVNDEKISATKKVCVYKYKNQKYFQKWDRFTECKKTLKIDTFTGTITNYK